MTAFANALRHVSSFIKSDVIMLRQRNCKIGPENHMITPIMYVLLSFVPAGILAGVLEVWRRFSHAEVSHSPANGKLLRPPGETCRRKMEELDDKIDEITIWVLSFPATLLICYVSNTGTTAAARFTPGVWISALLVAAGAVSVFAWKFISLVKERNNWRLGFSGERAVGEQLNRLMCDGCIVFHDFPLTENGNIDHIVVAPSGIFAIETKARCKGSGSPSQSAHEVIYDGQALEFPFHTNTGDLAQARDQAQNLGKFLAETIKGPLPVKPVLTLPGWYVINRGDGDVLVLNPKMIEAAILKPDAPVLSPERIAQISRLLDQKCRDIEF